MQDQFNFEEKIKNVNASVNYLESVLLEEKNSVALHSEAPLPPIQITQASPTLFDEDKKVAKLLRSYRQYGHFNAQLNPLKNKEYCMDDPVVAIESFAHPEYAVQSLPTLQEEAVSLIAQVKTAGELEQKLKEIYCGHLSLDASTILHDERRNWIQDRFEYLMCHHQFTSDEKQSYLERLIASAEFESYLMRRYSGAKRFGLEGADSLIPMLSVLIEQLGQASVKEIVIGMAHRGRLNVLINIMGKLPSDLFNEFEGKATYKGSGDVKYHQGFESSVVTPGGEVHLTLAFNPSHLEVANVVVEGMVRARQDRVDHAIAPIVIHGDSAFAGQGLVMETLQMSRLKAYQTGGTIHIVLNNQVGFTTHRHAEVRSTYQTTDIAKMFDLPVLRVNADDTEKVCLAALLASEYRMRFGEDIIIELVAYRRNGHNEADEPMLTQPLMYQEIKSHERASVLFHQKLMQEGIIQQDYDTLKSSYLANLDQGSRVSVGFIDQPDANLVTNWSPYLNASSHDRLETVVDESLLKEAMNALVYVPDSVQLHRQAQKVLNDRKASIDSRTLDWGFAELLAYTTLGLEEKTVRITGQDVRRGTFSHRHAYFTDQKTGEPFSPLLLHPKLQNRMHIYNSFLSEQGVLGFEYGYALALPEGLVVWEAQFGDFANMAQAMIDQFLVSSETKWSQLSHLALLLPHGYEGQGPEHSSARIERYLQMCADDNMRVCVPSTPAQLFHMLRRQVSGQLRKPLIAITPKSLLRHPQVVSSHDALTTGGFKHLIDDPNIMEREAVKTLVLCSGKLYYDIEEARASKPSSHYAVVRLEQLYPFDKTHLKAICQSYPNLKEVLWAQEEPLNQGAWYACVQPNLDELLNREMSKAITYRVVARPENASPAVGSMGHHKREKDAILDVILNSGMNNQ